MIDVVVHADWSCNARKRWSARARRGAPGWVLSAPRLVGPTDAFLEALWSEARECRVLAGFDFPIGLPAAYAAQTGLSDFAAALATFGDGDWARVYHICDEPSEISVRRPFYPRGARAGATRAALVEGLGVGAFDDLLRVCDRAGASGRAACSVFWTLGGNQVGRAAVTGWREIVVPARARGARLWPFDGPLATLCDRPGLILAETYPALAYTMVGAAFAPGESKRRRVDRAAKADALLDHARRHDIAVEADLDALIRDGFGTHASGEDRFDAVLGAMKMIEVVEGRRPERTASPPDDRWEGWILGR